MTNYTIHNPNKYLSSEIVQSTFHKGKLTKVDKQATGNGFSYGFLQLPIPKGKYNILIAPNKAVLIDKQQKYLENPGEYKNRIKFFYQESEDNDFRDADVLCFVADSFLMKAKSVLSLNQEIDKVLIDEAHSTEQQSLFRHKLIDFENKVKNVLNLKYSSIVSVTATPNMFSKCDITINNALIQPTNIIHSKDRADALKRIKNDIKNDENVVVFTNSSATIFQLRNYKKEVNASFIMGENLKRGISELFKIKDNQESKLTIVSSRGFEGFDIDYPGAKVYFFEDRSRENESFFISNLYQAVNRTRKGAKYIEYCRQDLRNKRTQPFKDIDKEINATIADASLSIEQKQNTKHKKFKPYLIFSQDADGTYSLKRNEVSIGLYKESLLYDKGFPSEEFKDFLESRKITVQNINEVQNRMRHKVKTEQKIKNLKQNEEYIKENDLFGDSYIIKVIDMYNPKFKTDSEQIEPYLKHLDKYLRCKNYDGNYIPTERENIALDLLQDEYKFRRVARKLAAEYNERSIKKYGRRASEKYRLEFKRKIYNTLGMLIIGFSKKRIYFPSKWIANRDYNLLTTMGVSDIEIVAKEFNTSILEVDILNCFPRVLYALNGLELPSNFYGVNKENKLNINIFLNNFFYDKTRKSSKKLQKQNAIYKFRNLGFDEVVIQYLMNNFFESKFKGDLFSKLSFHERNIITKMRSYCDIDNDGIMRRHDSVLVFNNKADLTYVNRNKHLDVGGWFNVEGVKVIDLNPRNLHLEPFQIAINSDVDSIPF